MSTEQVLSVWERVPAGTQVKHVEPLGALAQAPRLFETREALRRRFGQHAVTVLATGPLALPFRAVLAQGNALDYLALDERWAAAPGQRLLADATREWARPGAAPLTERLGILGHGIAHSRSPRIHRQPFDRLDLPEDTDLPALLEALRPHYAGFAVTNPFKKRAALAVKASRAAVNTLVRTSAGWAAANSDVDGAQAVLRALGCAALTVLGDGGVADALREAALLASVTLSFARLGDVGLVKGPCVWTWPATVELPAALAFDGSKVAVIAYGKPAQAIARQVRARGGIPLRLGARWFIAQARKQRRLWESAT